MANTSDKEFLIRVKADITKAVADMRQLTGEVAKEGREAKKAAAGNTAMARGMDQLAAAAAAYLTIGSAIKALRMADEWNQQQQRIKTATQATGDFTAVSRELYEITQRNGVAMADTVATFQRLSIARNELQATNSELLRVTESVQQLGIMSGASNTAMQAGLLQFGQAMSAGVVRAEELNSIIENIPAVAERIARGMNMTVGELRAAVLAGDVLSRDVFDSLLQQTDEINSEFVAIPDNLTRATNRLTTSFSRFLGQLDEATQSTTIIASIMGKITESLDNWSDTINPEGQVKFNQLMKERLRLTRWIARIEKEMADGTGNPSARNDLLLPKLRAQLEKINDEIRAMQDARVAAIKAGANQEDDGETGGNPTEPPPPRDPGRDRELALIEQSVRALELEAETYGMTREEMALYRLELSGATQAQLDRARSALEAVRSEEEFAAAVKASEEAVKAEHAAQQEWLEGQQRYLETVIASVDPTYQLTQELDRLARLMDTFPDHADIIQEAMLRVHEQMDGIGEQTQETVIEMDQFAIQAARNIQSAFADFLFDPFNQGLDGMLSGFIQTIHRMVSELLAQQLLTSFFTGMAGGDSGSIWATLAAGVKHTGGLVGSGPTRQVSPLLFANAPRYHSGGIAGIKPNEVPTILEKGEGVFTKEQMAAMGGGSQSQQPLSIALVDDRKSYENYLASNAGGKTVLMHIQQNAQAVKRLLT